MKQLIRKILTENTKLDKIVNILLRKYPNPMEDIGTTIQYLDNLGFTNEEMSKLLKYYIKKEFNGVIDLQTYFGVFDRLFKPEGLDYDTDDDEDTIFTNYTEEGDWNNEHPVMKLYGNSTLELNFYYYNTLNIFFGKEWRKPFKNWFENYFDMTFKRII